MKLHADRTALLLVDLQTCFVRRRHGFARLLMQAGEEAALRYFARVESMVVPHVRSLQARFRKRGSAIAYTEFGSFTEDGSDLPGWAQRQNQTALELVGDPMYPALSDRICRVDESMTPLGGEMVVQRTTAGPIHETQLEPALQARGASTVVVAGVVTDVCVAQSARELADRDFEVWVVEDACAALDEARHRAALDTIRASFGGVCSTDEVLQALAI